MDKFNLVSESKKRIASQIAELLNRNNNLKKVHTESSILDSKINYLIDFELNKDTLVLAGCVGVEVLDENRVFFRHLCVDSMYRRQGKAERLLKSALSATNKKIALMDIRHTNIPSLSLASKLGFVVEDCTKREDYYILKVKKDIHGKY